MGDETATTAPLDVGDEIEYTKYISDADIESFAALSGDTNPLHVDEEYAEETRFDGTIAHGVLVEGVVSATLAQYPGTIIYLSQETTFEAPVAPGTSVLVQCEVTEQLGDNIFAVEFEAVDGEGTRCLTGTAEILVDSHPEERPLATAD